MGKLNILISATTLAIVSILAFKSVVTPSTTATNDQYQTAALQSSTQVAGSSSSEELQRLHRQILELTDQVQALSNQLAANSNTAPDTHATLSPEAEEADALGTEFVNQMIAQGAIEGEDKILLNQHLGQMSPEGRKELTQRIAQAVNEQRLQFDPSSM